jgi:hypothetical protein
MNSKQFDADAIAQKEILAGENLGIPLKFVTKQDETRNWQLLSPADEITPSSRAEAPTVYSEAERDIEVHKPQFSKPNFSIRFSLEPDSNAKDESA